MRSRSFFLALVLGIALLAPGTCQAEYTVWFSPLTMSTADSRLTISPSPSVSYAIRVRTSAAGDPQWISLGLALPSDVTISGVDVCYALSGTNVYISQVRLSAMTTPDAAGVLQDDPTDLTDPGPTCYESVVAGASVTGAITVSLRLSFADIASWVDIGAIGVHLTPVASSVDGRSPVDQSMGLSPEQNRPNPFNPNTTISYQLDQAGAVDVSIFDAAGRLVRSLYRGQQTAGDHSIGWDGRNDDGIDVASGTYYYAIQSGKGTESRGMVLLR
jgi:hypothetical protein